MSRLFSAPSFAAGIVFGALVAGAWFFRNDLALAPPLTPDGAAPTALASSTSGAISVVDQPAGQSVVIESVTVPPPGVWVAVREVIGTELGNVLGAVKAGAPQSGVTVPLLRATEPDRSYAVELYRDDGNATFDLATDSVYVDFDTGERVVVYFRTTAS